MGSGGGGGGSGISSGQITQLANAMAAKQGAEANANSEIPGMTGGAGSPQLGEQYLGAMNADRDKENWQRMIASLGSHNGGNGYMG